MSGVWGILIGTAAIMLLGAGVIAYFGLQRRSRDQWRERVQETSQEVWHRPREPLPTTPQPRQSTFDEIWGDRSERGSAYMEVPAVLPQKVESYVLDRLQLGSAEPTLVPIPVPPVQPATAEANAEPGVSELLHESTPVEGPDLVEPVVEQVPEAPRRIPAPEKMPPSFAPRKSHWVRVTPVEPVAGEPVETNLKFQFSPDDRSIA